VVLPEFRTFVLLLFDEKEPKIYRERTKNQSSKPRSRAAFRSDFVPYWLKLSNFIEDFSRIRKLKAFMEIKQLA